MAVQRRKKAKKALGSEKQQEMASVEPRAAADAGTLVWDLLISQHAATSQSKCNLRGTRALWPHESAVRGAVGIHLPTLAAFVCITCCSMCRC